MCLKKIKIAVVGGRILNVFLRSFFNQVNQAFYSITGMEQKGKRTHGHGQQCGDCYGGRGLNDNGKNYNKN